MRPEDVTCPTCNAREGAGCKTRAGKATTTHVARLGDFAARDNARARLNAKVERDGEQLALFDVGDLA